MTIVEKVMLIAALLMPVVALLLFLPKFIKQKKSKPTPTAQPEPKAEAPVQPEPSANPAQTQTNNSAGPEFKSFAQNKNRRLSPPKRNYPQPTFEDFSRRFTPQRRPQPETEKPLLEEIKSLSPQLKALILSGAFDRKDYDD